MGRGEYTSLILDQMQAVLAPAGYKHRGKCFRAERAEAILLVQLQRDRYSTLDWLGVTVNLGVCLRALLACKPDAMSSIAKHPCHWYERIGFVTPYDDDQWWEMDTLPAAVEAGAEIAALLKLNRLPLLERFAAPSNLHAYWRDGGDAGITDSLRASFIAALDRS